MVRTVSKDDLAPLGPEGNSFGEDSAPFGSCTTPENASADGNPLDIFESGKRQARELACHFTTSEDRLAFARAFCTELIGSFWRMRHGTETANSTLPESPPSALELRLDDAGLASLMGKAAADLDIVHVGHLIGTVYTGLLPAALRSSRGIFYTPPSLVNRLLDMAEDAGVDWKTARVLDPASGGGAFLTAVAQRMSGAMSELPSDMVAKSIGQRLRGFEIDPFGAWISLVLLQATVIENCGGSASFPPSTVTVCDTLEHRPRGPGFDLVIGNPPYGRLKLSPVQRTRYRRSLFGHANLYGVFTDIAIRWSNSTGVIAYVTPTSFLAGEYFKALRTVLAEKAPPAAIDFVADRKGVFDGVLQETLLATYRRNGCAETAPVHFISVTSDTALEISVAGRFTLPENPAAPWILPRSADHGALVERMRKLPYRLRDYGYRVSTGPLVWNRHKPQLSDRPTKESYPIIWAEAVTQDGRFECRSKRRNHLPYFRPNRNRDDWLISTESCILVQRTTAKEQRRRLIAAELPTEFLRRHGGAVVENHLNMVRPINGAPKVSAAALAAFLNSDIGDQAFRCINGTVAVSAFELEALPLPSPEDMKTVEDLIDKGVCAELTERTIENIYMGKKP